MGVQRVEGKEGGILTTIFAKCSKKGEVEGAKGSNSILGQRVEGASLWGQKAWCRGEEGEKTFSRSSRGRVGTGFWGKPSCKTEKKTGSYPKQKKTATKDGKNKSSGWGAKGGVSGLLKKNVPPWSRG